MTITSENFVFISAILLFAAVMAGKTAYRFGAPALLLFLVVGMLFGYQLISFDSPELTQFIGMIALSIILFSGGMDTKIKEIRPILTPGVILATLGVAITALLLGTFVYLIMPLFGFEFSFMQSLLLAAMMSSTDSASVFSILRSKKTGLKENLRPLLELESGSNDPMAYILTVLLVGVLAPTGSSDVNVWSAVVDFMIKMAVGAVIGYAFGRIAVWSINRINIDNKAFYSVLLLAFVFITFSIAEMLHGNGYLAVYVAGLMVGNNKITHKRTLTIFFDSFTWLFQIVMFIALGLLVNLDELRDPNVLIIGGLVGVFMIFVARPATVLLCMAPFRKFTTKARMYVSWVGLRGAVPIIFATYPLVADVPGARFMFNVVYLVTILSLVIQGTTVSSMANVLGIAEEEEESSFEVEMPDKIKSAMTEIRINASMIAHGNQLKQITLPDHTLVVMARRGERYFIPKGHTTLEEGDRLLIISDNDEELQRELAALGITKVVKLR